MADDKTKTDPRDPDYSRSGRAGGDFFVHHNCSRCKDGERPCVKGGHYKCDWPHARND